MLHNYINVLFRNLKKYKFFSITCILCVAIALSASFIIYLYIHQEYSFDNFHLNKDRIYRLIGEHQGMKNTTCRIPYILANSLQNEIPEIEKSALTKRMRQTFIKKNDSWEEISFCQSIDPSLFDIFTINFSHSSLASEKMLLDPSSVVISDIIAHKYFPTETALGRIITLKISEKIYNLKIVGIFKDFSKKSIFKADILVPIEIAYESLDLSRYHNNWRTNWSGGPFNAIILIKNGILESNVNKKLELLSERFSTEYMLIYYRLQALKRIYFHSKYFDNNPFPSGDFQNVIIFSGVAVVILFAALVNYILLSLGRHDIRIKEIGLRRINGATFKNVWFQFSLDSIITILISFAISLIITGFSIGIINNFINRQLTVNVVQCLIFIIIVIMLGIASGSYLSLHVLKSKPIERLRENDLSISGKYKSKNLLILLQLVIFISLISITVIINKQLKYSNKIDLGFQFKNVLVVRNFSEEFKSKFSTLKNELLKSPKIKSVSASNLVPPTDNRSVVSLQTPNGEFLELHALLVEYGFIKTMEFSLLRGRDFQQSEISDEMREVILNETAADELWFDDPVDKLLDMRMPIIGVVKDFYYYSLHKKIPPMAFVLSNKSFSAMILKIQSNDRLDTLSFIKEKWNKTLPNQPFEYEYLEDRYLSLYHNEYMFRDLIQYFMYTSIIVTFLGLLGMSVLMGQLKRKEIGIRKVLGSSEIQIVKMLSKQVSLFTIIAFIISVISVIVIMNKWFQRFSYHINISIYQLLIAGVIGYLIMLIAIGVPTIQAARIDPIKVIRRE